MQFEERVFQTQFSVFVDKLYEWNIDGLSEQEIILLTIQILQMIPTLVNSLAKRISIQRIK